MTTPKHVKERVAKNPKLNPNGLGGGSTTHYKKEYCEKLLGHMALGYSFSSFGADVNTSAKTLYNWCKEFPEFEDARLVGNQKAKKFFEKLARMKMIGQKIKNPETGEEIDPKRSDTAMIIFFLKTRFRDEYSERIETDNVHSNFIIQFEEKTKEQSST